jgi:hypothetical protein
VRNAPGTFVGCAGMPGVELDKRVCTPI